MADVARIYESARTLGIYGFDNQAYNYRPSTTYNKLYKSKYPAGKALHPGSPLHEAIVTEIGNRRREAFDKIKPHYPGWQRIDEAIRSFKDVENTIENGEQVTSEYAKIGVSYTVLEIFLTYWSATFLDERPFSFEGAQADDVFKARLLGEVVNNQYRRKKWALNLLTFARDAFTKGFGIVSVDWIEEYITRIPRGAEDSLQAEEVLDYEGCVLKNLSPYRVLPDPDVPITDVADMSYFGWYERTKYLKLYSLDNIEDNGYFNIKYIEEFSPKREYLCSLYEDQSDFREPNSLYNSSYFSSPVDVTWMMMQLIPAEWDLGDSEIVEQWKFGIAGDNLLIYARPMTYNHGKFPICVVAPEHDGYGRLPIAKLSTIEGIQDLINWFIKSRVANVRKGIGDMFIYDPANIYVEDFKRRSDTNPGMMIRTKMNATSDGKKLDEIIKQFNVQDVTSGHVRDMTYLIELVKYVSGVSDALTGVMRDGERSATEFQGVKSSAIERLSYICKIMYLQGLTAIAHMVGHNTIQYMSQDTWVKVTPEIQRDIDAVKQNKLNTQVPDVSLGRIGLRPKDIDMSFDVLSHNGIVPNYNTRILMEFLNIIAGNPYLLQSYDSVKVMDTILSSLNIKDPENFKIDNKEEIGNAINQGYFNSSKGSSGISNASVTG